MKKLVSTILMIALLSLQILPTVSFADGAETATDNTSIQVNEARAEKLRRLGVLYDLGEDETEDLSKAVSRGEFAKILVKFFNKKYMYQDVVQKPYIDVELTDDYVRDIKVVKDLGCVVDVKALKFRPKETITLGDAGIMLLKGLGYENANKSNVLEVGLLDGIGKSVNDEAILDDIYAMLENAFDVEIIVWEYEGDRAYYKSDRDETILTQYYDMTKKRGIVTANAVTSLSEASKGVGNGNIAIDNNVYSLKNSEYGDYIGYSVDYYVYNEDSEVFYVSPNKNNVVTEIAAEDIESATDTNITYYKDKTKKKYLRLENNIDVIYNGKAYTGYGSIKNIIPENGSIVAIDNDNDGKAELIKITEYEYYLIKAVDQTKMVAYEAENNTAIDLSGDGAEVEIRGGAGNSMNFAGIQVDNVLSIAASKNTDGEKLIKVITSNATIVSEVTEKRDDKVIIDAKEYETTPKFYNEISVGQSGVFYLTHDGKIAFFKADTAALWNIALVRSVYEENNEDVGISLYTSKGEFIKYIVTDKVGINKTSDLPSGANGKKYVLDNVAKGDVIRYMVNGDEKISRIEIADKGYETTSGTEYVNSKGLRLLSSGNSLYFRNKIINGKYAIDENTSSFVVPVDEQWNDTKKYYTDSSTAFINTKFDYQYPYKVYVYDESDVGLANIFVVQANLGDSPISTESQLCVISNICTVSVDEEILTQVSVICREMKYSYYCDEELMSKYNLKKGDVVQLLYDAKKKIKNVRKIYNADGSSDNGAVLVPGVQHSENDYSRSFYTNGQLIYGTVVRRGDKHIEFDISTTDKKEIYIGYMSSCKFEKYDKSEKTVAATKYDDVRIGDKFVALISSGIMYDMIIVR